MPVRRALPPSLRLLALPIAAAWALSRWEVDGRSPHRALAGLFAWRLRPRVLAAGRRCPPPGGELAPLRELVLAPDLGAGTYPRGRLAGPARLLLRYPVGSLWRACRGRGADAARACGGGSSLAPQPGRRRRRFTAASRSRSPPGAPWSLSRRFSGGAVRPPHYFFWANLVLRTPTDAWAVYELEGQSYPGLSEQRKIEVGERLEALAYTLEADFQILRVARAFDAAAYERRALSTLDPHHGQRERFERHLAEHRSEFERRGALRPEIYLAVRLGPPGGGGRAGRAARRSGGALADPGRARSASRRRTGSATSSWSRCGAAEEAVLERVLGYLECSRVGPRRLAALIRRAYTRGLGEPDTDETFAPQALRFLDPGGEERFRPYGYDLLRLHESRVTIERRSLVIDSERGSAHQAQLVLGAMPEEALVPGPSAELMFTPLELGFPVDATLSVSLPRQPRGSSSGRKAQSRRRPDRPRGIGGRSRPLGRGSRAPAPCPRA